MAPLLSLDVRWLSIDFEVYCWQIKTQWRLQFFYGFREKGIFISYEKRIRALRHPRPLPADRLLLLSDLAEAIW